MKPAASALICSVCIEKAAPGTALRAVALLLRPVGPGPAS
jgi:hypothetical protein